MRTVTADAETLMRQASMTAKQYTSDAVEYVEQIFGEGGAEKYPAIVAAYIQAAALDFHAAYMVKAAETIQEAVDSMPRVD